MRAFVGLTAALLTFACGPLAGATDSLDALTLPQAVSLAMAANPDIRLSDLAVATATAGVRIADAAPNPTLTVGAANLNTQAGIGSGDLRSKTFDSSVRIEQLFERGSKRQLRTENAVALTRASRFDAEEMRRQTTIAVTQAFYDLLAAQERVDITAQSAQLMADTLAAARQRMRAGDLAPSDVTRIEVDALRTDNDAGQASSDRVRARVALAQLVAEARTAATLRAVGDWPAPGAVAELDGDAVLAGRADVRAAQARLDAARAASHLASAALSRDITVGLQYDHFPASATNAQGNGNSIGISVQIPLFWRNQFAGEIRTAELATQTALLNLERTRNAARSELARLSEDARGSAQRLARYQTQLLPAARRSAAAAEFAFQHGAIAVMDVLDVRRTYRQTLLEALSARADHARAAAALAWATLPEAMQ